VRFALAVALIALATPAAAAELDDTGKLRARGKLLSFDDASSLADWGALATTWKGNPWEAQLITLPAGPTSFTPVGDAPEGNGAIRVGGTSSGVLIPGSEIVARGGKRFELTFWARAYGTTPYLSAGYSVRKPYGDDFVKVVALRTGRETSDGWAEMTTGVIDSAIWDVPLSGVLIARSPWAPEGTGFAIDALEVTPVSGSGVAPLACTQSNVNTVCGEEGDCQYGHCLPGYASWGPLPPRAHREDLVARWIHRATRVQGDRNAAENAKDLIRIGPQLAWYATAPRPFFSGLKLLVNKLRDQHTQFGSPSSALFFPVDYGGGSATTGACFGPGKHDLLDDKLGYIVFKANKTPPNGFILERGDALTAIEGEPPLEWTKRVWTGLAGSLPNDPGADLGWSAQGLSWLLEKRASTIEVTRCVPDTDCKGANKKVLTVPVGEPLYEKIKGTGSIGPLPGYFWCDVHFQYALDKFAPNVRGENTVSGQIVRGDVLSIHFDGTYGLEKWSPSMEALFDPAKPPTKVLFDTRQGNGGYGFNSETVVNLLRPVGDIADVSLPIGGWDGATNAALLKAMQPCILNPGGSYVCGFADAFTPKNDAPVGGNARVAFLTTADVSANDYLARLVKGRSNLKIIGPGPTSGAFGSVSQIPSFLMGWGGGSLQMQDALFASSFDALGTATFESGKGVAPDLVEAQKMSDALKNRDTLVEAAHAWLAGGL
jgi:hypothetical protein